MTPDKAAMIAAFIGGVDPERVPEWIALVKRRQRSWRYRLFAGRWEKEADRRLIERLKARITS